MVGIVGVLKTGLGGILKVEVDGSYSSISFSFSIARWLSSSSPKGGDLALTLESIAAVSIVNHDHHLYNVTF